MKPKKLPILISLLLCLVLTSNCKVTYQVAYQTYLEGTPKETLMFEDSIIKVTFDTRPNGILFDIENLTKNNLYIIWDKSYFIDPKGNSSKPLNTDLLETNAALRDKENNESVIPQGAHFKRFTCSAKNITLFSMYNSLSFYDEVSRKISTNTNYSKFYLTGNYWYLGQSRSYSSQKEIPNLDKAEITTIQKFIRENNNLGVGFTIKDKTIEKEYHFKFPIMKAIISKKTPNDFVYDVIYELDKENSFQSTASDK